MTGNLNNTNLFFNVAVLFFLSLRAVAQDSSYSADSLIATFRNGSQSPLKGTEIRFSDRVVEVRRSTVTFKSSGNDKVTCDLVSPIPDSTQVPPIGSPLTVVGKVRGRGVLGNVTLDQCKLAPVAPLVSAEPVPPDPPQDVSEVPVSQAALADEPQPETLSEVPQTPLPMAVSTKSKSSVPVPASTVAAPAVARISDTAALLNPAQQKTEEAPAASVCADFPKNIPYGSHLLVALFTGIGTLTVSKLRHANANRLRTLPGASAQDVRRAALEALLSKHKK